MYLLYVYTRRDGLKTFTAPSERAARKKAEDLVRRGFFIEASDQDRLNGLITTFLSPSGIMYIEVRKVLT